MSASPPRPPTDSEHRLADLKRNLPAVVKLLQLAQEEARNEEQLAAYISAASGLLAICRPPITRGPLAG